jgi:hypothetical protein
VDGVGFEPEAHQNGFDAQYLLESGDDGDTSTPTHCQRFLSKSFFKTFFGGLVFSQMQMVGASITNLETIIEL